MNYCWLSHLTLCDCCWHSETQSLHDNKPDCVACALRVEILFYTLIEMSFLYNFSGTFLGTQSRKAKCLTLIHGHRNGLTTHSVSATSSVLRTCVYFEPAGLWYTQRDCSSIDNSAFPFPKASQPEVIHFISWLPEAAEHEVIHPILWLSNFHPFFSPAVFPKGSPSRSSGLHGFVQGPVPFLLSSSSSHTVDPDL